ncbi:viroplasmin family protein [Clostridium thermarum]|uniref:ribonuclease H1 domain-containing protein n=1 Tax=Clostridium thermarum TaxID=1716543 RepID=UPI0013D358E5|nr:ribonuclease H family protein [Clostridium thermarum]
MPKKYYAIKEGFDRDKGEKVVNLIVETWGQCESLIKGVKGAKYKSFTTIEEAKQYLAEADPILRKGRDQYPLDVPHAYVDGSFNIATGKYSYGLVITAEEVIIYVENGAAADDSHKDIRQIGGELKASIRALQYCAENNIKEIVIFHDYEGVCYHATGFWERREESSRQYYEIFNKIIKDHGIKVHFVKVDSHTGDLYNEMVDEFAKSAGSMELNKVTEKMLKSKHILVKSKVIKDKFTEIIKDETALAKVVVVE